MLLRSLSAAAHNVASKPSCVPLPLVFLGGFFSRGMWNYISYSNAWLRAEYVAVCYHQGPYDLGIFMRDVFSAFGSEVFRPLGPVKK
jgi:hypothetical protein